VAGDVERPEEPPGRLRGLLLRGGRGGTGLPGDNPWGLPEAIGLEAAIRRLWAPVADALPAFVDRLVRQTFALAIVDQEARDQLVYLTMAWVSRDVPDVAAASIEELMGARESTVGDIWGTPPLSAPDLPPTLRALASVHGCLTIVDDERYVDLERLEPYDQDGYVMFAGRPDAWYVLDLGWIRDGTGDPTVLAHDPNDGLILSSRERLRPFLDQFLYDVLDADS